MRWKLMNFGHSWAVGPRFTGFGWLNVGALARLLPVPSATGVHGRGANCGRLCQKATGRNELTQTYGALTRRLCQNGITGRAAKARGRLATLSASTTRCARDWPASFAGRSRFPNAHRCIKTASNSSCTSITAYANENTTKQLRKCHYQIIDALL